MADLRESDMVHEIGDRSDGIIIGCIARLIQGGVGLFCADKALHSVVEKGLNTEAGMWLGVAIGLPIIIEWLLRVDKQQTNEMYDQDTGVVDD